MDLQRFFKKEGYDLKCFGDMERHLSDWGSWYKGDVASFHNYTIYNGEKKVPQKRLGMQMAKKVSEDWANLLMNERVEFSVDDGSEGKSATQERLLGVLSDNDFWVLANRGVELSFALGTGAFVLGLGDLKYDDATNIIDTGDGRIDISFIPASKIFPLSYEGNDITECAFATRKTDGKATYVYVSMHVLDDNGDYLIRNYVLKETGANYTDITDQQTDFIPEFETKSNVKWFSILRPNIVNNINLDNPYGISVFANAIPTLKSADIIYDSLANEFLLGRKRIFVSAEAIKVDIQTGESKLTFDPNDVVFYSLPSDMDGKQSIIDTDMTIRADEHEKAIYLQLNILSSKVGFGEKHYKFDAGGVVTATQVISENSSLFRTLKKHEITLENCLFDLFKGIMYIGNTFINLPMNMDSALSINFDDSIIEDKSAEMTRDLSLVNAGLMQKYEFRMKYFTEDMQTAKNMILAEPTGFENL